MVNAEFGCVCVHYWFHYMVMGGMGRYRCGFVVPHGFGLVFGWGGVSFLLRFLERCPVLRCLGSVVCVSSCLLESVSVSFLVSVWVV